MKRKIEIEQRIIAGRNVLDVSFCEDGRVLAVLVVRPGNDYLGGVIDNYMVCGGIPASAVLVESADQGETNKQRAERIIAGGKS